MQKTVIGLDFGSDSVRAILVEATNGHVIASSVSNYPRWAAGKWSDASKSQFRQHPLDYLECMENVIRDVLKCDDPKRVAGIAVDTTGSTPCAVDRNGTPLALTPGFESNPNAMFVLWKDHTALQESVEINNAVKASPVNYLAYEGGIYSPEWFFSKVLHILRTDEKVRENAFSWVEHCDWITGLLAGNTNPLTMKRSRCAAGHKAMWHTQWNGLPPEEFLASIDPRLAGLRQRLYTDTVTADTPTGTISKEWADRLGLPRDVVIGGSAFDCHFGAVGASIKEGCMVKVIGTSTCDIVVSSTIDKCVRGICGQVDGSVVPGMTGLEAGQSAFGDIYAWFKSFLSYGGDVELARLEKDAALLAPQESGVMALDWLNARRTPDANPFLRGAIFGLNLGTTAPMVYRALIESTAFGAKRIAERFQTEGVSTTEVSAIGGIARKSPLVMQILADVMNVPIRVVATDQACALGAAMFAAVAAGIYKDVHQAMTAMDAGYDRIFQPNAESAAIYAKMYQHYIDYAEMVETDTMKSRK